MLEESKKHSFGLREQRVGGADVLRFFCTANGEAYGFTVGGKIYSELKTDDEIADRVIKDLLEGVDPRMMGNMEDGVRFNAKQKRALETATIAEQSTNNATVVSSADGAKILNELERTIEKYKNISNRANMLHLRP